VLIVLLCVYGALALIGMVIAIPIALGEGEDEHVPKIAAACVFWPLVLAMLVLLGSKQLLSEYVLPKRKNTDLSRRQRRAIEFDAAKLAIQRKQNDEHERAMRIITGQDSAA